MHARFGRRLRSRAAIILGVLVALLSAGVLSGASPAAASHLTSATYTNLDFPGNLGTFRISGYWETNAAHTGVRPHHAVMKNETSTKLRVYLQKFTFYPGGNVVSSNETQIGQNIFDYEMEIGEQISFEGTGLGPSTTYANLASCPTWRIYIEMPENVYHTRQVVFRMGTAPGC